MILHWWVMRHLCSYRCCILLRAIKFSFKMNTKHIELWNLPVINSGVFVGIILLELEAILLIIREISPYPVRWVNEAQTPFNPLFKLYMVFIMADLGAPWQWRLVLGRVWKKLYLVWKRLAWVFFSLKWSLIHLPYCILLLYGTIVYSLLIF